jgi:hypothetical protein
MNTLTEQERNGLDEVFKAIQSDKTHYSISTYLASLLLLNKSGFKAKVVSYLAKNRIKLGNFFLFIGNYTKKKKNLSK